MKKIDYEKLASIQKAIQEINSFLNSMHINNRFYMFNEHSQQITTVRFKQSEEYQLSRLKIQKKYVQDLLKLMKKEFKNEGGV
jgi:alcohol dehydrogenase YqhD (iron-dependent ADH family)